MINSNQKYKHIIKTQNISQWQQKNQSQLKQKVTITSIITGGKRRLVYAYQDGRQVIQQYDMKTHELLSRRCKKPAHFKESQWIYEVGEPIQKTQKEQIILKTNNAPIFLRKDTLENFQWRIRNLPYPTQTYILEVDKQKQQVVIKTTVKKYYKRFDIPDLKRINTKLNQQALSFEYKNMTLIVSYKKPEEILEKEIKMRKQFDKLNAKKPKQGDIECNLQ